MAPDPLPGPTSTTRQAPELLSQDTRLGVLVNTADVLEVTPKATITDEFTDLDDWVTVLGEPEIVSGTKLGGEGVVRHKTKALSDSHKVTGTLGDAAFGRTRLYCSASADLKTYYAVEVEQNLLIDKVNFIKGTPQASIEAATGLLGVIESFLALLYGLLSIFNIHVTPSGTVTGVTLFAGDALSIWYDRPNSTVRVFKNDVNEILAVPVPRGEIPRGEEFRHHGVAVGLEFGFLGARFESYECVDI